MQKGLMMLITIIDVFDSNVPNIDNGKIWIDINKLWQITGLENQASYFIVKGDFNKAAFPFGHLNLRKAY